VISKRAQIGWSLIVLVWLPMLAILVWGRGGILDLVAIRREIRDLESQVESLKDENGRLKAEVQRLARDPDLYERVARERFFYKKPGELIIYLPPSQEGGTAAGTKAPGAQPAPPKP
jgi:cell division protein FtsB